MLRVLPDDGTFVEFIDPNTLGLTIGHANVRQIPIFTPENFDTYREEARKVIKVIKGESSQEEALELGEFGYNAMGCNTFLAALAYEILEQESHL